MKKITVGILTSSRADYSIYLPLLKKMRSENQIDAKIIAFGTHLSRYHGYTKDRILKDKFTLAYEIDNMMCGDTPAAISSTLGLTVIQFSNLWKTASFDLVFALGDRYEMFAAVIASLPFNIKIAHLHGGETTLGAIDNVFRHSISLTSSYHFVSTEQYKERLRTLIGSNRHIYNVGALSIENISKMKLFSVKEFYQEYGIDLGKKTILCTFHPETVSFRGNEGYINELLKALESYKKYQIVFTMPNADTMGSMIRNRIIQYAKNKSNVFLIESFGSLGYLSAMKYCSFMIGNSSSGFVEASYFPKKVINIGQRQSGRIITKNIYECPIHRNQIIATIKKAEREQEPEQENIYGDGNTSEKIINIIKKEYNL